MHQLSASLSLKEALAQSKEMTEVRDENGALIGFLMSPPFGQKVREERRLFYKYLESLFPKEELEAARNSHKWYSTDEVLKLVEG